MISDFNYWSKVLKKILNILITTLIIVVILKIACFYMPFLIAFIIAMILEPIIKFIMKKLKISRKLSSIIIISILLVILIGIVGWGITTLINEGDSILKNSDVYINKIQTIINDIQNSQLFNKIPNEFKDLVMVNKTDYMKTINLSMTNFLNNLKNFVLQVPNFLLIFFFSLTALYFMCTDKIYMIDQLEHHIPDNWSRKLFLHLKEITSKLSKYLEAEAILIFISFVISLIGLWIFKLMNLGINYPFIIALGIAFVDALPILGSGTVMVPWAILEALNGKLHLGLSIMILFVIMTIIRNFMEPKLVSKHIGVHPVFSIIAMYTGFKLIGILGLIIGPILLIILKEVYGPLLDKGIFRSIFERAD